MCRLIIIVLLALLFMATAKAEPWTTEQKQLGIIAGGLYLIDYGQTRHIAKNPHQFKELNPLIGTHPTLGQVNRHFLISSAIIFSAAHFLPQYRSTILKTFIVIETVNTIRNYHIGIRMEF